MPIDAARLLRFNLNCYRGWGNDTTQHQAIDAFMRELRKFEQLGDAMDAQITQDTKSQSLQITVPQDAAYQTGGILAFVCVAIGGFLAMRRRLSRDNTEIAKDRAENDVINTLQELNRRLTEERDKAMETAANAWRTRTEDAKTIGELSAKVEHMSQINTKLEHTVNSLLQEIETLRTKVDSLTHALAEGGHS